VGLEVISQPHMTNRICGENTISKTIENKQYTVGVFLDLKAFETVDHDILLETEKIWSKRSSSLLGK